MALAARNQPVAILRGFRWLWGFRDLVAVKAGLSIGHQGFREIRSAIGFGIFLAERQRAGS